MANYAVGIIFGLGCCTWAKFPRLPILLAMLVEGLILLECTSGVTLFAGVLLDCSLNAANAGGGSTKTCQRVKTIAVRSNDN